MPVSFNHIIVGAHDPQESADFYLDVLGARPAPGWGPFVNILLDDDTLLQFAPAPVAEPIQMAFLMDDTEFDRGYEASSSGRRPLGRSADASPERDLDRRRSASVLQGPIGSVARNAHRAVRVSCSSALFSNRYRYSIPIAEQHLGFRAPL